MLRHIDWKIVTDIPKQRCAFVLGVKQSKQSVTWLDITEGIHAREQRCENHESLCLLVCLIDAQSVFMFIIPTVLIQYVTLIQTVHTQHFIIIIHKATCFGYTRQPSTDFTFNKYMICESMSGYCEQRVSPAPVLRCRQRSLVRITQRYAAAGLRLGKDSG